MKRAKKYSNLPMVRRCKYWTPKIFNKHYYISIGYPIAITNVSLGWKDKYNSPRFEWCPTFAIYFFNWQFIIWWTSPDGDNDKYYEQILWYLYYSKDIKDAKDSWGWVNTKTKESTWNDKYLIKK